MAIQILPKKVSSGGEAGRAFGAGFLPSFEASLENRTLREALTGLDPDSTLEEQSQVISGLNIGPEKKQQVLRGIEALKGLQDKQSAVRAKQEESQLNLQREQRESQLLARMAEGEELTLEERGELSPTTQRSIMQQEKPVFEPKEAALEAERVSELASEIENDYKAAKSEEMRLGRMESLDEKGKLSTPVMVKALKSFGIPLGVLGNPDSEEYAKLEADFLRDVRQVFPGGRITNYEIQAYLKTVPGLMNSSKGRKSIIRNRKLMNDAKRLRYDAYRDVIKENKGVKPRNMGLLIDDKISQGMAEIEDNFRVGMQEDIEKFQQPLRMRNAKGRLADIPAHMVEQALQEGFKF